MKYQKNGKVPLQRQNQLRKVVLKTPTKVQTNKWNVVKWKYLWKNKTENPFSLQDDEKNWHDRQLLHFMTKTWKFLTCVTLKWLADNLNMTCSKLVLDLDVTCTRLNMTWTFTHDFTMTWAKLANDLELTQNWWMWQKLNQLTLFYLWKLKSTMTTTTKKTILRDDE